MKDFPIQIVTPDGVEFEGQIQSLLVKTVDGDVEILASHTDLLAAIDVGRARLSHADGTVAYASVSGGFLSVRQGEVRLVNTTFEFSADIDSSRAERAKADAEKKIRSARSDEELRVAKAKLSRALCRLEIANKR